MVHVLGWSVRGRRIYRVIWTAREHYGVKRRGEYSKSKRWRFMQHVTVNIAFGQFEIHIVSNAPKLGKVS